MPLAGYDHRVLGQQTVEVEEVEQQVGTRHGFGSKVLHEGIPQSACRSGTRLLRAVAPEVACRHLREQPCLAVQRLDRLRRCALLRPEDCGGTLRPIERIAHVAGEDEAALP